MLGLVSIRPAVSSPTAAFKATMAGYKIIEIKSCESGLVDIEALKAALPMKSASCFNFTK